MLQGTESKIIFQSQSCKAHFARSPFHLRVEPTHHRIMTCGYQQLLAKHQGNCKFPLESEKVISPVIKSGKKESGEAKGRAFVTKKILNQIATFSIYMGNVILETSRCNLVPNKEYWVLELLTTMELHCAQLFISNSLDAENFYISRRSQKLFVIQADGLQDAHLTFSQGKHFQGMEARGKWARMKAEGTMCKDHHTK